MFSFTERNIEKTIYGTDSNGYYTSTTTVSKENILSFFLMPGFRFQSTESKAFQVSLAGVIYKRGPDTFTFPMPMCSWFFKL